MDHARARWSTGRWSCSSTVPPTSARSTPRWPISPRPGSSSRPTPTSPTSTSRRRSGPASTPTPSRWCAKYFELEDPRTVRPIGLELKLEADLGRTRLRGIIDRLELDEHGEFVVTDYKTGSVPSELWEAKSLSGVHMYALLCERMLGRRPARVQLFYLSKPEAIIATPTDQSIRGVERRTAALYDAIANACSRDDFQPKPGRLCDFCTFKPYCPAHGGDPVDALELRGPGTVIEPSLPLPLVPAG